MTVQSDAPAALREGPTVITLLRRAARRHGDATAFIDKDGSLTYRAAWHRVRAIAALLRAQGVGIGDRVAQLVPNSTNSWCVQAATYVLGARFVGLQIMGSPESWSLVLEDAEPRVFVTDIEGAANFRGVAGTSCRLLRRVDITAACAGEALDENALPDLPENTIARMAYTGGTTGRPKGVLQSHRVLVTAAIFALGAVAFPPIPHFFIGAPLTHGAGTMVLPTLIRGGSIHIAEHFDPDAFIEVIEAGVVNATWVVPTMLYKLLDHPRTRSAHLGGLELVVYTGAPASPTRIAEAVDLLGPVLQQLYGQTEAPQFLTSLRPEDHRHKDWLASVGFPLPGVRITVQGDDGAPVPPGQTGEICVRGQIVADGYWRRPEETAQSRAGDWLHTGDVGYEDSAGCFYLVDRKGDLIITGGFNVYPREVEDALMSHPAIADAVVVGVPDLYWGEAIAASVVLRAGATADADDLIAHVRAQRGKIYAPKLLRFLTAIPTTAVGKPDRRAIRADFARTRDI